MSERVQRVHHQHAHMISVGHATGQSYIDNDLVIVKGSLHQAFSSGRRRRESFHFTHCTITPQISKLKAHNDLVHFDEAVTHVMQFPLVISCSAVILHFRCFDFHKVM